MNDKQMRRAEIEAICLAKRNGRPPTFPRLINKREFNPKTNRYEYVQSMIIGNCTDAELQAYWAANPDKKAEIEEYQNGPVKPGVPC